MLLEMKGSQPLHKHMRQLYGLPARRLWRLLQPCKVTWIDSTMSWGEGHRPIVRVKAGLEHDLVASIECNLEANAEFDPEVDTGPTLKVGLRIGQEPKLKIITKLIPKMNRAVPRTISGNPQIRGSASGCLKMGIWWQSGDPSAELPIKDLESWQEYQVDQLGTPTWWGELKAIPGMADLCRFTQKIRGSFHVPEIWSQASPSQDYSTPPVPRSLNWGAFIPERLEYQDVWQRPILLTKAYCQSLQHWEEKSYPPTSPDACPLVESIKELCLAMSEFVTITKWDILEGLEIERPIDSHWPPSVTLFSWVLGPPTEGQETTPAAIGIPQQNGMLRPWGRAHPVPSHGTNPATYPFARGSHSADISTHQSIGGGATFYPTPRFCWHHNPHENAGAHMTRSGDLYQHGSCWEDDTKDFRISSMSASRIVWDNSTRSIYLDTIATSIGRMVLGGLDTDALSTDPTIEEVTGKE